VDGVKSVKDVKSVKSVKSVKGVKDVQVMVLMSYIASNFTDQAIAEMNSRTPQGYACVEA
jgi:hypothetical protein